MTTMPACVISARSASADMAINRIMCSIRKILGISKLRCRGGAVSNGAEVPANGLGRMAEFIHRNAAPATRWRGVAALPLCADVSQARQPSDAAMVHQPIARTISLQVFRCQKGDGAKCKRASSSKFFLNVQELPSARLHIAVIRAFILYLVCVMGTVAT